MKTSGQNVAAKTDSGGAGTPNEPAGDVARMSASTFGSGQPRTPSAFPDRRSRSMASPSRASDLNGEFSYDHIDVRTVIRALDNTGRDWSYAIRKIRSVGDSTVISVRLSVAEIHRDGIGTGIGTAEIRDAEAEAFKDAALKFASVREALVKSDKTEEPFVKESSAPFVGDPTATSTADLVTPKQLGAISAMARSAGIDGESECVRYLGCKIEDLSRPAASKFISHLRGMGSGNSRALRKVS
jgi:hypothetical protein